MNEQVVIDIVREGLVTVIMVSLPLLLLALFVGLIVSIFQATTSIQEPTLAFVPKILAVFIGMVLFGPYMIAKLTNLFTNLYSNINYYIK